MSALLDSLRSAFESRPASSASQCEALQAALADGLPSQRSERWKYTSLRALAQRGFALATGAESIDPALLADIPAPRLVFINGVFDAGLSQFERLPAGVSLQPWSAANAGDVVADDTAIGAADEVFLRLNMALAEDGVQLRIAAGQAVTEPLHLVFIGAATAQDLASHLRHRIEIGADASLALVEHHLGDGHHRHLANHRLQLALDAGASLKHVRLQDESEGASLFARTDAVLADTAVYRRVDLELGGALSRHELNVQLQGGSAQLFSAGVLLAGGRRHLDTRLGIEHIGRDSRCELNWRGLAAGRGRVAFHGGIHIHAGADGSDAALSNKNLLLSDSAEIDSQPVLEIHADEVKAAHGATVGQLDGGALFYLRSRGIPQAEARRLLTRAFCHEVLATLDDAALLATVSKRLDTRLEGMDIA